MRTNPKSFTMTLAPRTLMETIEANLREYIQRVTAKDSDQDPWCVIPMLQNMKCERGPYYLRFTQSAYSKPLIEVHTALRKLIGLGNTLYREIENSRAQGSQCPAEFGFQFTANTPQDLARELNAFFPDDLKIDLSQFTSTTQPRPRTSKQLAEAGKGGNARTTDTAKTR